MQFKLRKDFLAYGAVAVVLGVFLLWYFSVDAQYARAVDKVVSQCPSEAERDRIRELSKYVLPEEKALTVLMVKDRERLGRTGCSFP